MFEILKLSFLKKSFAPSEIFMSQQRRKLFLLMAFFKETPFALFLFTLRISVDLYKSKGIKIKALQGK